MDQNKIDIPIWGGHDRTVENTSENDKSIWRIPLEYTKDFIYSYAPHSSYKDNDIIAFSAPIYLGYKNYVYGFLWEGENLSLLGGLIIIKNPELWFPLQVPGPTTHVQSLSLFGINHLDSLNNYKGPLEALFILCDYNSPLKNPDSTGQSRNGTVQSYLEGFESLSKISRTDLLSKIGFNGTQETQNKITTYTKKELLEMFS